MVESVTPEREVGVRYLPPPCCVLEQRHIYSPKILVIHRKRWLCPDMCSAVSSMLSGLETRSLGRNTLGTT